MRASSRSSLRPAAVALVLLATASCGDDNSADSGTAAITTGVPLASAEAVPPSTTGRSTTSAESTSTTEAGDGTGGSSCRMVTHELGEVCVPAEPERIVVIDPVGALPTLLDLDAPIVGAASVYDEVFPDYIDASELEGVEIAGGSQAVNVERVAATRPDLIVGSVAYLQDYYEALSALAPTVVPLDTYYNADWQETLLDIGDLVGGSDRVQGQLDAIASDAERIAAELIEAGPPPEVTRMDLFQGSPFVFRHGCVWWGSLLESAGVTQPEAQQGPCTEGMVANGYLQVAPEQLEIVDGDLILVDDFQGAEDIDAVAAVEQVLGDNPLWAQLGAVQRGDVVAVDDAWGLGAGERAAEQILADLEQLLLNCTTLATPARRPVSRVAVG